MEQLTQEQLDRIKKQRIERFKKIGLPENAGQIMNVNVDSNYNQNENIQQNMINENTSIEKDIREQIMQEQNIRNSDMYNAPRDKYSALQAIKNGLKKQEFNVFIKAESHGSQGVQLPEPKVGKRKVGNANKEKVESSVKIENFGYKQNSEAIALENMFTESPVKLNLNNKNIIETDENYSNVGPEYDPVSHLKKKMEQKQTQHNVNKNLSENSNQIFSAEPNFNNDKMIKLLETLLVNQNNNDIIQLKKDMRTIAEDAAKSVVKSVLNEYINNHKKQNTFEVVNSQQNIIKIKDSYYKLQKVNVKRN